MLVVVLEDAPGGVVHQVEVVRPRDISQRQHPHDVGPDGLGSVVLAPINVWPASNSSGVEYVRRLHARNVLLHSPPVLQSVGAVLVVDPQLCTHLAEETTDPAGPGREMQEDQLASTCHLPKWLSQTLIRLPNPVLFYTVEPDHSISKVNRCDPNFRPSILNTASQHSAANDPNESSNLPHDQHRFWLNHGLSSSPSPGSLVPSLSSRSPDLAPYNFSSSQAWHVRLDPYCEELDHATKSCLVPLCSPAVDEELEVLVAVLCADGGDGGVHHLGGGGGGGAAGAGSLLFLLNSNGQLEVLARGASDSRTEAGVRNKRPRDVAPPVLVVAVPLHCLLEAILPRGALL